MSLGLLADQFSFYSRLSATTGVTPTMQVAVDWARTVLDGDFAFTGTVQGETLAYAAGSGMHQPRWKTEWTMPLHAAISGIALETGKTLYIRDFRHDPRRTHAVKSIADDEGLVSALAAPILGHQGRRIGLLYIGMRRFREFGEEEHNLLLQIAAQIGARCSELESSQRQVDAHLEALQEIEDLKRANAQVISDCEQIALVGTGRDALDMLCERYGVEILITNPGGEAVVESCGSSHDCVEVEELRLGEDLLGRAAIHGPGPLSPGELAHLRHGLFSLARRLLSERFVAASRESASGELFDEMISGRMAGAVLNDRLVRGGYDLRPPFVAGFVSTTGRMEDRHLHQLIATLRRLKGAMVHYTQGGVGMLLPCPESNMQRLRAQVREALDRYAPGLEAVVGLSRPATSFDSIDLLWKEARAASMSGHRSNGAVVSVFSELGPAGLLKHMSEQIVAQDFVTKLLEPLFASDRENGTDYVRTLCALVETGGNLDEAARRLHMHSNSVRYRLDRLRTQFAIDFRDRESRFSIELAVRLFLLGASSARSNSAPQGGPG